MALKLLSFYIKECRKLQESPYRDQALKKFKVVLGQSELEIL